MEDENAIDAKTNQPKKKNRVKTSKEAKKSYGKLNLMKYFIYEVILTIIH